MENNENTTIVIDMLKQITATLSKNQTILFDEIKSLDAKYQILNDKMDKQYKTLNDKIDKHYEENRLEHIEMRKILFSIQKDVKALRDDVDTIYDLEKDSRKKIRKLF